MPQIPHIVQRVIELLKRYPGIIALGGFLSGIGSFMLVDRQESLASWVAVLMLVSWLWLMFENTFTQLFTRLFKRFGIEDTPTETTPQTPNESKPPMDEATATALKALLAQLLVVAAGIQAVIEPAAEDAPEPDQAPIDDVSAAVDEIVTTAEEEREFKRTGGSSNKAVLAALTIVQRDFQKKLAKPVKQAD